MSTDLLEPRAAVDWAVAQLKVTESRIEAWRESGAEEPITYFDPDMGKDAIKHREIDIPLILNAEIGTIINSIRSSLDILAVVLAARNGFPDDKETYFPICRCVYDFIDPAHGGLKKIKRLSAQDRSIIEGLGPYQGGNDYLWALHQMDVTRKHRKLLSVHWNIDLGVGGKGLDPVYPFDLPDSRRPKDQTILMWVNPGTLDTQPELTIEITLARGETLPPAPVIPSLREFCGLAYSIINRFR